MSRFLGLWKKTKTTDGLADGGPSVAPKNCAQLGVFCQGAGKAFVFKKR
jgi:hypothetical protein